MRRYSAPLAAALLLLSAACGGEKGPPAGPEDEVVGVWVFDAERVAELAAKRAKEQEPRVRKELEAKYAGDAAKVETELAEMRDRRAKNFSDLRDAKVRLEIRADGTMVTRLAMGPAPAQVFHGAWVRRGGEVFATAVMCLDPKTEDKTYRLVLDGTEGVLRYVEAQSGMPRSPIFILTRPKE